jgi:hypothetical protein
MMAGIPKRWFVLAGMILFAVAVVGCGGGGGTVCATGSLQRPDLNTPADFSVVGSLSPTLSWTYPDASCHPEGYRIDLSVTSDFSDTSLSGGTGNPSTNWGPGSPLQPGTQYWWRVAAINGTTLGPFSNYRRFFTGPECDPASLGAPSLLWPMNGQEIDTIMPLLEWQNGNVGCVPGGYGIHLSSTADFSDTTFNGGTGNPSTRWFPGDDLADCTNYFWHVFAGIDTTFGPESMTYWFRTNASGTCPPPGNGAISGKVFHDLCALIDGPMAELPPGCVDLGADGWAANGVYDPGEPGIAGVRVRIGLGGSPKPTILWDNDITDSEGEFSFVGLPAGDYTVFVDALEPDNVGILIPGGWTLPRVDFVTGWQDVSLGDGDSATGVLLGWDYQFLPEPAVPTPTPTPPPAPAGPFFQWKVDPDHIYYRGTNCGAMKALINAQVADPKKTRSMGIFFRLLNPATGEATPWGEGFAMTPKGGGYYDYLVNAESVPDFAKFREAVLQFQLVANDDSGAAFERSALGEILFSACGQGTVVNPNQSPTHK